MGDLSWARVVLVVLLLAVLSPISLGAAEPPEYTIVAIRYATLPQFPVSALVVGAPEEDEARRSDGVLADLRRRAGDPL